MADTSKPLFSRPVLAAIMLFCTLAIWLLNLTAPNSALPTPNIDNTETASGIPIVWLTQDAWQQSDKLDVSLVFQTVDEDLSLAQTTFAMLMSDSLPLSTSPINQRLSPLAAQVSSHYEPGRQTISLTMSNELAYLRPTLSLVTPWLNKPDFKYRTLDRWQRQQKANDPTYPLHTLAQIKAYYAALQHSASTIFVIGYASDETKTRLVNALDQISQRYQSPVPTNDLASLSPVESIQNWLSLQLWKADTQHTSSQDTDVFQAQLVALREYLEQQALSPTWWRTIATQVTDENGSLTLATFAENYKNTLDTFTIEDYRAALARLPIPSPHQETQVDQ
ncbi:hypothetical protein [Marinomonas algarum]|uniref:Uncharacterized protein n=1 Tax=Marinomonas algarum TaxID=2883105 RepID=A0A9X1LEP6_9GAMM|nr:hypothetical protein [Marinomonas algarum]MCB5161788.1 hypothetical protein [Marinomonas algarum]